MIQKVGDDFDFFELGSHDEMHGDGANELILVGIRERKIEAKVLLVALQRSHFESREFDEDTVKVLRVSRTFGFFLGGSSTGGSGGRGGGQALCFLGWSLVSIVQSVHVVSLGNCCMVTTVQQPFVRGSTGTERFMCNATLGTR